MPSICWNDQNYLKSYLISGACDGAAVMFGCHNGIKKLFTERFPSLIVWHCVLITG
jgi:hypothetical protein